MYLVTVFKKATEASSWRGEGKVMTKFICASESRANFHAGVEIDALTDETGFDYDYSVTPVQERG